MIFSTYTPDIDFVQSEDRYTAVANALKIFNKMDLEKLTAIVRKTFKRSPFSAKFSPF